MSVQVAFAGQIEGAAASRIQARFRGRKGRVAQLRSTFESFDYDGSGTLEREEISGLLIKLGEPERTAEELEAVMAEMMTSEQLAALATGETDLDASVGAAIVLRKRQLAVDRLPVKKLRKQLRRMSGKKASKGTQDMLVTRCKNMINEQAAEVEEARAARAANAKAEEELDEGEELLPEALAAGVEPPITKHFAELYELLDSLVEANNDATDLIPDDLDAVFTSVAFEGFQRWWSAKHHKPQRLMSKLELMKESSKLGKAVLGKAVRISHLGGAPVSVANPIHNSMLSDLVSGFAGQEAPGGSDAPKLADAPPPNRHSYPPPDPGVVSVAPAVEARRRFEVGLPSRRRGRRRRRKGGRESRGC